MATFTITRNSTSLLSSPLTVNLAVSGTATYIGDYTVSGADSFSSSAAVVTIPANQLSTTITVNPTPDSTAESDETVILTIVPTEGVSAVGSNPSATLTIVNDDGGSSDPNFADVGLLLHLDGNFTDSSSQNLTVTPSNLTFSTSTFKFGTGSAQFNGSDGFATLPTATVLNRGTGDFTLELQINIDSGASTVQRNIFSAPTGANGLSIGTDRRLVWWLDGTGNLVPGTPDQLIEGIWNYIAVIRSGGTTTIRLNDAVYASFSNTTSYNFSTWQIGKNQFNSNFKGFVDEVRFSTIARTISAAPTSPFPNS